MVSVSLFSLCLRVSSSRLSFPSHCSLLCVLCSLSVALSTLCSPSSVFDNGAHPAPPLFLPHCAQADGWIYAEHDAVAVMYDDEDFSWGRVYQNASLSCTEGSDTKATGGPVVSGSMRNLPGGRKTKVEWNIEEHLRPRMWYLAVVRCPPPGAAGSKGEMMHAAVRTPGDAIGRIGLNLTFTNPTQVWRLVRRLDGDKMGENGGERRLGRSVALGWDGWDEWVG